MADTHAPLPRFRWFAFRPQDHNPTLQQAWASRNGGKIEWRDVPLVYGTDEDADGMDGRTPPQDFSAAPSHDCGVPERVGPEGWKRLAESLRALGETDDRIKELAQRYGLDADDATAAPAPDLLRRCLDTVNALLGDMEGQGSWTQIDDDLLPELQARQRELTAACGVKAVPAGSAVAGQIEAMTTLIDQWHDGPKNPDMWMAAAAGALSGARATLTDAFGVDASPAPSADPLDRAKEIRERVDALDAEREALWQEYLRILPAGKIDAEDMAWATGKDGVDLPDGSRDAQG